MDEMAERRLREMADRSWSRGIPCYTDFLDLAEQTVLKRIRPSLSQPEITLFGGAEGCERVMAGFGVSAAERKGFPIACLRVTPTGMRFASEMNHRDVLGSLMSLGFERSLLGDIVIREKEAFVFCAERIADYVCDGLTSIRRTSVGAARVREIPEGTLFQVRREVIQVASERMDALVAHAFRLSRGEAQGLFPAGKVFLDGAECTRPDTAPGEGQIVSVRGLGRFRFIGAESVSRKGKQNTVIERYV
ncbi:MAG: hypothetical protein IKE24_11655 [Clostridia bacterium]|nr:hypothetical protein [Clostridia bacterium]